MGCLRRLGCLAVLLVAAVALWLTRGSWLHFVPGTKPRADTTAARTTAETWQQLTPTGAKRAEDALKRLSAPSGPAFATLAPGDLAALIMQELAKSLPKSADSIRAAAIGDRLYVRAVVRTSDLGGSASLGPLAMIIGEREPVQIGGTLRIIRPGFAELQVKEFKIHDLKLPQALIPRLIKQMSRGERPAGLSPDGLPLRTPDYVGDVRVSDGKITLYKTVK